MVGTWEPQSRYMGAPNKRKKKRYSRSDTHLKNWRCGGWVERQGRMLNRSRRKGLIPSTKPGPICETRLDKRFPFIKGISKKHFAVLSKLGIETKGEIKSFITCMNMDSTFITTSGIRNLKLKKDSKNCLKKKTPKGFTKGKREWLYECTQIPGHQESQKTGLHWE